MTDKILFFDTETTGTDPATCELVELGFMGGSMDHPVSYLFRTKNPIPPEASAVHNITNKMVEGMPFPEDDHSRIIESTFLQAEFICAHNLPYDHAVMTRHFPWFKAMFPNARSYASIDTLRMARHLYPDFKSHKLQVLRYALDIEIPDTIDAHRAGADVIVLKLVFLHMLDDWLANWGGTIDNLVEWIAQPITVKIMPFGKYHGTLVEEMHQQDPEYCRWLCRQPFMAQEHPDLLNTLSCLSGKLI